VGVTYGGQKVEGLLYGVPSRESHVRGATLGVHCRAATDRGPL
jgi:hypothetical protein